MLQVCCGHHDVNLPTRSLWFPCQCVHVHCLTVLGDGPRVVPMAHPGRSTGAPCPFSTHLTPSNHGHVIAVVPRYGTCPTMTCLGDPSRVTQWRSKPVHTMEIQAGSHNGDPKTVHIMEIQSRFTQWRSKPVHTMEIQSRFTQWRSKPVHTMEIQAGSQNGDLRRSTQWRSKLVHAMEIQSQFTQCRGTRTTSHFLFIRI